MDYAKNTSVLTPSELESLVRSGDLSVIYRRYEEQLQSPLRNMVVGDLVRLLLIQVQKSKVDLELAMTALDKLLKANELNFAILTVVPAGLLVYWLARQISNLTFNRRRGGHRRILSHLRHALDAIERLLLFSGKSIIMEDPTTTTMGSPNSSPRSGSSSNGQSASLLSTASSSSFSLSPRDQGSLLLHVISLQVQFSSNSSNSSLDPWSDNTKQKRLLFQATCDLADIPTVSGKLLVIQRIYRTHGNLLLS